VLGVRFKDLRFEALILETPLHILGPGFRARVSCLRL
jgi:hypothetical protein